MKTFLALLLPVVFLVSLRADGPADNVVDKVRPVPPPGLILSDEQRKELQSKTDTLGREIGALREELKGAPLGLLPDIQIFHKAIGGALQHNEFFRTNELGSASKLLDLGLERVDLLRGGKAPWLSATGLVVRGYVSRIDGSVQPYGLVVPASYHPSSPQRYRLDFWFHGRDEKLTELSFLEGRLRSRGEFTPPDAFVVHLYGRFCNGSRFAGEVDLFETLEHIQRFYPIDPDRLVVRGFSLGGAACWHFATHHAGLWAAAAPGAGFSETADFLKVFQQEKLQPTWWEQKLWHLYDATDYAVNLFQCPTVAYSGEVDRQKQAADVMAKALEAEGMELAHVIGPRTAHRYHPDAKIEIDRRIDSIVARGRDRMPSQVRFTTWTLRYNQMAWVTVDGLEEHWERARVDAEVKSPQRVVVSTKNVAAFTLAMPAGYCPLDSIHPPEVILDGKSIEAPRVQSDRSWTARFSKTGKKWQLLTGTNQPSGLQKRHGLQGPIDDAFMDSFLFVRPTGKPLNDKTGLWVTNELQRAVKEWRRQFRGEVRVKNDVDVTEKDLAGSHVVLWGDPSSNRLIRRIAEGLPIRWSADGIQTAEKLYPAGDFVPVLIYPNPLNPERYAVLNSGFTFREYDYLNNARQTPKLPDFAIIDLNVPANSRSPGGVIEAGFFDEKWQLAKGRRESP